MKEKERDIIDDLFQSKLQDMEVDVAPQDWDMIASRLPRTVSLPFYRKATFWSTAAAVALLMVISGLFLFEKNPAGEQIAQEIERRTEEIKSRMEEEYSTSGQDAQPTYVAPARVTAKPLVAKAAQIKTLYKDDRTMIPEGEGVLDLVESTLRGVEDERIISPAASVDEMMAVEAAGEAFHRGMTTRNASTAAVEKKKPRRWGFGMGAGGVSVGSNNVVPTYMVNAMGLRSEDLIVLNAPLHRIPRTDVNHNKPISFGLGVNYYLTDRISLQSGVVYTYLSSDWKTSGEYQAKITQKLHFVGIPLGATYKIAEWNRFMLYAGASFQLDMNVAGQQRTRLVLNQISNDKIIGSELNSVREKKLLLSANARVGVSYPIFRFLSTYAEGGAGYYFDNGSALFDKVSHMPTIYSEKPFNFSFSAGLRIGL